MEIRKFPARVELQNTVADCPMRNYAILLANPTTHQILFTCTDIDAVFGYNRHELTNDLHTLQTLLITPNDIPTDMAAESGMCTDPDGPGTFITFQGRRKDGTTVWFDACVHITEGLMCWMIRDVTLLHHLSNRSTSYRNLLTRFLPLARPPPASSLPKPQRPAPRYFYHRIARPALPAYKSIFILERTGVIEHVYPPLNGFLRYTTSDLISRPVMAFVHPSDVLAFCGVLSRITKLQRLGAPVVVRWRVPHRVEARGGSETPRMSDPSRRDLERGPVSESDAVIDGDVEMEGSDDEENDREVAYVLVEVEAIQWRGDVLCFLRVLDHVHADHVLGIPARVETKWWEEVFYRFSFLMERWVKRAADNLAVACAFMNEHLEICSRYIQMELRQLQRDASEILLAFRGCLHRLLGLLENKREKSQSGSGGQYHPLGPSMKLCSLCEVKDSPVMAMEPIKM
ncbi:hypothetical protein HK097_001350 [Rhizophlyctis rosea]|uniref:Uncharacterized protein n=1 Tax=Rhizophlyctis rosea TaxID=64517 RepID=A0AAD5S7E3_9FUNG|nr:hypothetical protein HK097_001350 [Rhizophlyctis rosea]